MLRGWPEKAQDPCCSSTCLLPLLLGDVHGRHEGGRGLGTQGRPCGYQTSAASCVYNLCRGGR